MQEHSYNEVTWLLHHFHTEIANSVPPEYMDLIKVRVRERERKREREVEQEREKARTCCALCNLPRLMQEHSYNEVTWILHHFHTEIANSVPPEYMDLIKVSKRETGREK
jgi:hypothetical protein